MEAPSASRRLGRRRSRWPGALAAAAMIAAVVSCGGSDSATPTLTWYINPDPNPPEGFQGGFGQAGIAERCSTEAYRVETELLPGNASEQRIQLARRLAADDPAIALMSLDPPFTAEFADAGFLAEFTDEEIAALSEGMLQGAIDGATWEGRIAAAPLWANTQVLWYRKSIADAAGLDMTQPVTWDQIITAATENNATVGVQANKYEGYVVWINALIQGAGGLMLENVDAGLDATVTLDSEAGTDAAAVINELASSSAALPDLSVSNEGTVLGPFSGPSGGFVVNWTYTFGTPEVQGILDDVGWTTYPATVEGQPARPPIGGINIGVNAAGAHPDLAKQAAACISSEEQQVLYALDTANMPARSGAYDDPRLRENFPADLLDLWRESVDTAGPRPTTPYWNKIVSATLNEWHPPGSVRSESTPESSQSYVEEVLRGEALT